MRRGGLLCQGNCSGAEVPLRNTLEQHLRLRILSSFLQRERMIVVEVLIVRWNLGKMRERCVGMPLEIIRQGEQAMSAFVLARIVFGLPGIHVLLRLCAPRC